MVRRGPIYAFSDPPEAGRVDAQSKIERPIKRSALQSDFAGLGGHSGASESTAKTERD